MGYPTSIDTFRTVANRAGVTYDANKTTVVYAEDHNKLATAVKAIETELGTNPSSSQTTVAAAILAMLPKLCTVTVTSAKGYPSKDTLTVSQGTFFVQANNFGGSAYFIISLGNVNTSDSEITFNYTVSGGSLPTLTGHYIRMQCYYAHPAPPVNILIDLGATGAGKGRIILPNNTSFPDNNLSTLNIASIYWHAS